MPKFVLKLIVPGLWALLKFSMVVHNTVIHLDPCLVTFGPPVVNDDTGQGKAFPIMKMVRYLAKVVNSTNLLAEPWLGLNCRTKKCF